MPFPRIGYFFSRYPFRSQTFTDNEMLGLEARGRELVVGSIYPPPESFRQPNLAQLHAAVLYGPPRVALARMEQEARRNGWWPEEMVRRHETAYGASFQSATRARNALYFAREFARRGVTHVHVPFANRALHSALFLKEMTGIPFSFTTHGQDFMVDLGNDDLLREMCAGAEFVVAVCDYSQGLLREICPASADRIVRVFNGLDPAAFPVAPAPPGAGPLRVLSVGRLIEFKGFHHLIEAVALAREAGREVELDIVGEGPWKEHLESLLAKRCLTQAVRLSRQLSSEEVRAKLAGCDVFALASTVDAQGASDLLPTVITEAMLSGRAVLGTRVAGLPEMIEDGVTGRLVAGGDPKALAAALSAMDRTTLKAWGEAGRRRAERLFIAEKTIPVLEGHFARCTAATPAPPRPGIAALYDLTAERRTEWLRGESAALRDLGVEVFLDAHAAQKTDVEALDDSVFDYSWIPDGMVLEAEWRFRETWRNRLESLRTELSTAVDGELFLRAARKATWIATTLSKAPPALLFAPGTQESLTVWLASRLLGIPCALAFDEARRWNGELLRRMAADAVATSDATGRANDQGDSLRHGVEAQTAGFAFFRWKRLPPSVPPQKRTAMLRAWLGDAARH